MPESSPQLPSRLEKLLHRTAGELRDLRGDYQALLQTVMSLAESQQQTQQELARLTRLLEARSSLEPLGLPKTQTPVQIPVPTPAQKPAQPAQPAVALSSESEVAKVYWQQRAQALRDYQPVALRPSDHSAGISLERAADGHQLYYGFLLPKQRFAVVPDLERAYHASLRQASGLELLFLLSWAPPGSEPGSIRELTRAAVMIQEAGRWLLIQKGQLKLEPGS